jgi:arsenate reductase (glutaredoxin)
MQGIVSFYEKPGCQGNARQKEKLKAAGYMLQVVDMISKTWDEETLLQFFGDLPIHQCVNQRAPIITSGELNVNALSESELLAEMIASPILIKRPLIFFRGRFGVGFDNDLVTELLGVAQTEEPCRKNDNCTHP